jgi:hypothetical protein
MLDERRRERDIGKETEGNRQRKRDRGKMTEEKIHCKKWIFQKYLNITYIELNLAYLNFQNNFLTTYLC